MSTLILDNEAVQALRDPAHPKHKRALSFCEATNSRSNGRHFAPHVVVVPVAVRVEAELDRTSSTSARFNLLSRSADVNLDAVRANSAATIRLRTGVSAVDASVIQAAAEMTAPVQILTSDGGDMRSAVAQLGVAATIIRL